METITLKYKTAFIRKIKIIKHSRNFISKLSVFKSAHKIRINIRISKELRKFSNSNLAFLFYALQFQLRIHISNS